MSDENTMKAILDMEKSLDTFRYAEIVRASTQAFESLRHIYENPGIKRMMESIRASEATMRGVFGPTEEVRKQHEALMRASLGPMEELRQATLVNFHSPIEEMHRAAIFDFHSPVQHQIEVAQRAIAGYTERFRLPDVAETALLLEQFRVDPMKDVIARFAEQESSLQRAMASMQTPWLDMQEQMRSIKGFVELQGIGAALQNAALFDESMTAALRVDLGDWRDTITWPKDIFTDLAVRSEFYAGLGFNQALTDFPAPAFEQSVNIAGLRCEPPALIDRYGSPIGSSEDEEEERGLVRTNEAHDLLLRLETQLRKFIDEAMTGAFGVRWASRITLEIVSVRVERLHEISAADAIAEGIDPLFDPVTAKSRPELDLDPMPWRNYLWHGHIGNTITAKQSDEWPYQFSSYDDPRLSFSSLWESINGAREKGMYSWTSNPFVWVLGFRRFECR